MTFDAQQFLDTAPSNPGVYRMYDLDSKVIYVGKAKNLKKRLQSYFRKNLDSSKTQLLMSKVVDVQVTVTHTENEALILENNLIKEFRPRYNILMRDDKSYPYIVISKKAAFPRISAYRGVRKQDQRYFGPYPNGYAVKQTIELMQKLFRLRTCTESFFKNRSRPCLQYQIKRCSAPCVGYVESEEYQATIKQAELFLKGKNKLLTHQLSEQMQQASADLKFEKAAIIRDQIQQLTAIQEQQHVMQEQGDFDVIYVAQKLEQIGINLLNIEQGKLLGNKTYFLKATKDSLTDVLAAFISQHYLDIDTVPHELYVNLEPSDQSWLASALAEKAEHKVKLLVPQRGEKLRWLELSKSNLEQALATYLQQYLSQKKRWTSLTESFAWDRAPNRIECFDISHSHGEATVASCVVFDEKGAVKKDYRRFNINDVTAGDDYTALYQAIQRRYSRLLKDEKVIPDVVLIDGGKGQLQQAIDVFEELRITSTTLLSISKGPGRNPNYDIIWQAGSKQPLYLAHDSISLHLLQQIRDEAHRFAITGHKNQRGKKRQQSVLEGIEGVGAKRRRELLKAFGGLQGLQKANVEDIAEVPGISPSLAEKIYQFVH